jgi:hypothetical protein
MVMLTRSVQMATAADATSAASPPCLQTRKAENASHALWTQHKSDTCICLSVNRPSVQCSPCLASDSIKFIISADSVLPVQPHTGHEVIVSLKICSHRAVAASVSLAPVGQVALPCGCCLLEQHLCSLLCGIIHLREHNTQMYTQSYWHSPHGAAS